MKARVNFEVELNNNRFENIMKIIISTLFIIIISFAFLFFVSWFQDEIIKHAIKIESKKMDEINIHKALSDFVRQINEISNKINDGNTSKRNELQDITKDNNEKASLEESSLMKKQRNIYSDVKCGEKYNDSSGNFSEKDEIEKIEHELNNCNPVTVSNERKNEIEAIVKIEAKEHETDSNDSFILILNQLEEKSLDILDPLKNENLSYEQFNK